MKIKSHITEIIYTLVIGIITILINYFFDIKNQMLSQILTLLSFVILYFICGMFKNIINPFEVEVNINNYNNSNKQCETDILINKNKEMVTVERMRTVKVCINIIFNNSLSKFIIISILKKSDIILRISSDARELKLSSQYINDKVDNQNPRYYYFNISNSINDLSTSNQRSIAIKEEKDLIIEFIGTTYPIDKENNINIDLYLQDSNKFKNTVWTIFKCLRLTNSHKTFIKSMKE
ncbi:hypothetical protein E4T72_09815 [Staphylococcus xylosus]|uniref:hypothetical protein n=1 Tax=Staphylococcus xylosus TaxID=1288 RepID=UPI001071B29D|nr:hypothetical protein [Staphylococcus xylosus]MBF0811366.1 hypothetical protein [Staphylococcus xylosus]TFV20490.1 hypothetical protein E4T72_09815 [Staphylococcus xylosus]